MHATINEVVAVLPPDGLLEQYTRVLKRLGWRASAVMAGMFHHQDHAGMCGCHRDDFVADSKKNKQENGLDNCMNFGLEKGSLRSLSQLGFVGREVFWYQLPLVSGRTWRAPKDAQGAKLARRPVAGRSHDQQPSSSPVGCSGPVETKLLKSSGLPCRKSERMLKYYGA